MRHISLYIHVPFCKRRCSYCTFYHVPHIEDFETAFVDKLIDELEAAAEVIGEPFIAPTVFFGGGTPSVLRSRSLRRVFAAIAPHLSSGTETEITLETNPEDVTVSLLDGIRECGVNRISLGIQSMDPRALRTLKRCSPEANERAMMLVASRFDNFSVDLLLGTPGGTVGDVAFTLERIVAIDPPHVSVYCLEPGGVMEADMRGFFDAVDAERSADEYLEACSRLERNGYLHYEVSNFAKPGRECRHNGVYWNGAEYLGLGPGAHSMVGGVRFSNEPSIEAYVAAGGSPLEGRRLEPPDDRARALERVMLALRTSQGLRVDELSTDTGLVEDLVRRRLAVFSHDRHLRLTNVGYLLLDEVVLRVTRAA